MIPASMRIAIFIAIAVYFVLLVILVKKKSLKLKYSLLWFFAGLVMLVLNIFPGILTWFSGLVGFTLPVNALYAFVFFCLIILQVELTAIVSKLSANMVKLTQNQALLEKRIEELEKKQAD